MQSSATTRTTGNNKDIEPNTRSPLFEDNGQAEAAPLMILLMICKYFPKSNKGIISRSVRQDATTAAKLSGRQGRSDGGENEGRKQLPTGHSRSERKVTH